MDKYIENLVEPNPYRLRGGVCRSLTVNEEIECILIEDVTKVEFNSLYPNLLVRLYSDGVLKKLGINIDPVIVNKVKFFLENRGSIKDESEYIQYRIWINALYANELRPQSPFLFDIYYQYMVQYFNDIEELNKYTWLYTDTDMMYFAGRDVIIPDIGLTYSQDRVELLYIERMKKYVEYTNDFKTKGYRYKPDDIINMMKQKIRVRRLNSLGI